MTDSPKFLAPPILIYATFILLGYGLNFVWPVPLLPLLWSRLAGMLLTLSGLVIYFSARRALAKAGGSLATTRAYLRTRNPMYLSFTWIYLGLAAWINSLWPLVLLPVLLLVMMRGVVLREEAHLEAAYGKSYRDYKARTRRWM